MRFIPRDFEVLLFWPIIFVFGIGALATFAFPYVMSVIDSVKQVSDLDNIAECGRDFYLYADEHDGIFPTTNTTSTDLFNEVAKQGYIINPRTVSGSGTIPVVKGNIFSNTNVGWSCAQNLTTNDNHDYPLLWSRGSIPSISGQNLIINCSSNYWGLRGKSFTAVFFINGSVSPLNLNKGNYYSTNKLIGSVTNVYTNYLNP